MHPTERCEDDRPNLITHVETTAATTQDVTVVAPIHHALAQQTLLPAVHLVDGAYTSGEQFVSSQQDYQMTLSGPLRQDQSWQAHDERAYDIRHLTISWDQERVTCPQGQQSQSWKPAKGPRGKPTIQVAFAKKTCATCEVRPQCARSPTRPRGLTLHPHAQHLAMQAAREEQQTAAFQERYKRRAGIEGTVSQAVFAFDMRRTRYRGRPKTPVHHLATAAAINLQRVIDWLAERPLSQTRLSRFVKLASVT